MSVYLKSLKFTRSVGSSYNDSPFSDMVAVGEFPFYQKIQRISEVEVYAIYNPDNPHSTSIKGLRVKYLLKDGSSKVVTHGLVDVEKVGQFTISDDQSIVGAYGKHRLRSDILGSIGFVLFNKKSGEVENKGPFYDDGVILDKAWAIFGGNIISFEGTENSTGITSLGFVLEELD